MERQSFCDGLRRKRKGTEQTWTILDTSQYEGEVKALWGEVWIHRALFPGCILGSMQRAALQKRKLLQGNRDATPGRWKVWWLFSRTGLSQQSPWTVFFQREGVQGHGWGRSNAWKWQVPVYFCSCWCSPGLEEQTQNPNSYLVILILTYQTRANQNSAPFLFSSNCAAEVPAAPKCGLKENSLQIKPYFPGTQLPEGRISCSS